MRCQKSSRGKGCGAGHRRSRLQNDATGSQGGFEWDTPVPKILYDRLRRNGNYVLVSANSLPKTLLRQVCDLRTARAFPVHPSPLILNAWGFRVNVNKATHNTVYCRLEKNPSLPMKEFEAMLYEFQTDYNQTHFVRNDTFKKAANDIQGPARKIFIEFLERSCTAEFSGFLLYKELGRRLKKTNPVGKIFTPMPCK